MSIDIINVYKDRVKQIETDEKRAIYNKKWTELAKLREEKSRLLVIIDEKRR